MNKIDTIINIDAGIILSVHRDLRIGVTPKYVPRRTHQHDRDQMSINLHASFLGGLRNVTAPLSAQPAQSRVLMTAISCGGILIIVAGPLVRKTKDDTSRSCLVEPLVEHDMDTPSSHDTLPTQQCCIMVHIRSGWYDNSTIIEFSPADIQDINGPNIDEIGNLKFYAMPLAAVAPLKIATRVNTGGALLYICPHNPLLDRPLLEIEKLFEKTSKGEIMLVVILPEAESLDAALKTNAYINNPSIVMCQPVDWSSWLGKLDTAVFTSLTVIMPFVQIETLRETFVWQTVIRRGLSAEILEQ